MTAPAPAPPRQSRRDLDLVLCQFRVVRATFDLTGGDQLGIRGRAGAAEKVYLSRTDSPRTIRV
jgi:hypothetical protein